MGKLINIICCYVVGVENTWYFGGYDLRGELKPCTRYMQIKDKSVSFLH